METEALQQRRGAMRRRGAGPRVNGGHGASLEEAKNGNNYLFGQPKWKSHVTKQQLESHTEVTRALYTPAATLKLPSQIQEGQTFLSLGNTLYVVLFGWWVCGLYLIVGLVLACSLIGLPYSIHACRLGVYFLWPFGKYIEEVRPARPWTLDSCLRWDKKTTAQQSERSPLLCSDGLQSKTSPLLHDRGGIVESGSGAALASVSYWAWVVLGLPLLVCVHLVVAAASWLSIAFIPTSKVFFVGMKVLLKERDCVHIRSFQDRPSFNGEVVLSTYQASNIYYYKYKAFGMSVIMVNLLIFVPAGVVVGYMPGMSATRYGDLLITSIAIIPLSYTIGMSISTIAAQSTYAVGAVLNATFGSIIELVLYYTAIRRGLAKLVRGALTGSLLGFLLFVPGLCMVVGGIKYKEQNFNAASAGVSSTLLFVSVVGAYAPTLFYKLYGYRQLHCQKCVEDIEMNGTLYNHVIVPDTNVTCLGCYIYLTGKDSLMTDSIYVNHTRPLVYLIAGLLPVAYIIGLVFTLKTHEHIYHRSAEEEGEEKGGHEIPLWSRKQALVILFVATAMMALNAEVVVDKLQEVVENSVISEECLGITMVALIPNVAEIANGVQFALQNNIRLSIEVGNSVAAQVCLLQIPILVLVFAIVETVTEKEEFPLIFSDMEALSVISAVVVMNYIFQDGKCNYLQGAVMVIIYIIMVSMFLVAPAMPGLSEYPEW